MNKDGLLTFILGELYSKLCDCRKNYEELEPMINPVYHLEECPYRVCVEKEDIEWKKPTQ